MKQYEQGQYVRSRGGYPARALGINDFCLRKTPKGDLLLDVARQPDVTVQEHQVPSVAELEAYLAKPRQTSQARAQATRKTSMARRQNPKDRAS
jgi:hypothetical protein